jgi:N-acetylglucosaminyl-diphospho-decaprenol L-rhamnosyltransferase
LHDHPQGVRLETVVVDNASQDGAADLVAREFPEVRLIRNDQNHGFARANNQAAAVARGRYLFFLNNDTVVPPLALRQMLDYAVAHPEVGMLGPRLRGPDGHAQISYRQRPTVAALLHRTLLLRWTGLMRRAYYRYRRRDFRPGVSRPVEALMGAAVFLPRRVFFECGRWDEDFAFGGEDLDLSTRVGRRRPLVFFAGVEILHHGRVSSRLNIGFSTPSVAVGYVQYFRKAGAWRLTLWAYKTLVTLDAPVQVAAKSVQYLWRRLSGRPAKAAQSWLAVRGAWHFLSRGLLRFWRA